MIITEQEANSFLWTKITAEYNQLLAMLQRELEKSSNSEITTSELRGRIKEVRRLLTIKIEVTTQGSFEPKKTYR